MKVRNVHVREVAASAAELGVLLDRLGGPDDELWPVPQWAPMELDRPLRNGSAGGHGAIRYRVTGYDPGRRLECTLDPGLGLRGTHTFTVEPLGPRASRLRHVVDGHVSGAMLLGWPVAVRWLHDAVVEDLFDRAEARVGAGPVRPVRWSWWVRLLRRRDAPRVQAVPLPHDGLLDPDDADAADAVAVAVPAGMPDDPRRWADVIFREPPPLVTVLLGLRDALVGLVGIERSRGDEFEIRDHDDCEVLLGADAGHLDFRCVVRVEPGRVVLATTVQLHGARGRLYWSVVRHIHPWVVRAMLTRAARRIRDTASGRPRLVA
ncbi:DUF2867 domain-containing protein [Pseudonocardia phyllosphaerae]|uniref:DUF2867 domain-containing protein n=1 Tax=Pseudonocardia phyllosphaerae TaxID=3390502 RepID=UPI003979BD11